MIPIIHGDLNIPLKLNGIVTQWQRITWQDFCESPSTEKFFQEEIVSTTDLLYRLVISRGSAKLTALVAIKNNFPAERSIFNISISWNGVYHSANCDAVRVSILICL